MSAGKCTAYKHMEETFCRLMTKEELREDIQREMVQLYQEKQRLTIEYREKMKKIDSELAELDYKLMSGNY